MIIRPLTVFEREAVRKFYLSLSPEDRRKRFCCTLSDETISGYVDRVDFARDTMLGVFDEQAQIIGLAELVRGAEASEMAFSVRPDRRGQKIGTRLMQRLLLRARICGIGKVFVMFLSDNTPMRRMADRAGMALSVVDGEAQAVRELPPPSAEELAQWYMEESVANGEYFRTLEIVRWGSLVHRSANAAHESLQALTPAA
ncbi:MAG: N-acetyltransferase family protein [Burkholderiales bacterium]